MTQKKSIFKDLFEKRRGLAVKIGLTGIIFLLFSLLAQEYIPISQPTGISHILNILIELSGKIGEAFILSGFVVFVLEEHPLALMVKDVSRSIIDEIIDRHFSRNELIGFILKVIRNLNKYEHIDDEIYTLYEKYGLLELTEEPRLSNVSIIFKKEGEVEGENDKIILNRIYDFMAKNEATEGGNSKMINRDGLVAVFNSEVPGLTTETEEEILKNIHKYQDISFKFSSSFEINGYTCNKNLMPLEPIYIKREEFDIENCRGKNSKNDKEINPKLYVVYDIISQSDGNKLLKLNAYFNVKIPPKEFIELFFEVKGVVPIFDLWMYEFISFTKGATFELQLGDDFETKIEEILIGAPNPPIKSNSKLKYNGWIMPHSSISGTWRRKL
ncbi:MAG: hypothetical protein OIN87_07625 [Candidatus Methanoperedens sp.]|nr:hypothetical protein [Candidatus Methanoperedens sp.]